MNSLKKLSLLASRQSLQEDKMTKHNIGWDWYSNGKRAYYALAKEVKGSDGKTFEPLSFHWARDKNAVYCFDSKLRGADRDSFEVLNDVFAKDAHRVYYLGGTIKDADPDTFTVFPEHPADAGTSFAKDKNHVYFQILTVGKPKIVRDADPQTFRSVGRGYGIDSKSVYSGSYRMKEAKVDHWRMLCSEVYSCDDKTVFCGGSRMDNVHPETFQVLPDGSFARDKGQYFNIERTISAQDYVDHLRQQFIFTGTIVGTSVVDGNKEEVPGCTSIERMSNHGVRLQLRCDKILFDPGIKVDETPVAGEEFAFYQFLTPSMFPERIGQPWIWFFHPLSSRTGTTLVPNLGWRYFCPIEKLDEIKSILEELL